MMDETWKSPKKERLGWETRRGLYLTAAIPCQKLTKLQDAPYTLISFHSNFFASNIPGSRMRVKTDSTAINQCNQLEALCRMYATLRYYAGPGKSAERQMP